MRIARVLVWFALLGVSHPAWADSFYLESEPMETKDAAAGLAERAGGLGCPGSVQRRYLRGEGWRFLFRSHPVSDAARVGACLEELADARKAGLRIVSRDSQRLRGAARTTAPAAPTALRAEEVLARLTRAHGNGADLAAAPSVLFRFLRAADGRVVEHTYAREAGNVYVEVVIVEGHGRSSRAGLVDGAPWMDGAQEPLDAEAAREQLRRFSPEHVLAIPTQLARGDFEALGLADAVVVTQKSTLITLEQEGDRSRPPVQAAVHAGKWELDSLSRGAEGQRVHWRFEGWRRNDLGVLVPSITTVSRGDEQVDRVEVTELDLSPTLPSEWFPAPAASSP